MKTRHLVKEKRCHNTFLFRGNAVPLVVLGGGPQEDVKKKRGEGTLLKEESRNSGRCFALHEIQMWLRKKRKNKAAERDNEKTQWNVSFGNCILQRDGKASLRRETQRRSAFMQSWQGAPASSEGGLNGGRGI